MKETTARFLFLLVVIAFAASACAPKPTTATPTPVTIMLVVTATPVATSALAPIDLGGPVMEVGATYPYVDGSTLVAVPEGEFTMGYGNEDNLEHKVTLGDFWIYRDEVTNGQYALCVLLKKCSLPDTTVNTNYGENLRRNDPVTGVNWDQAQAYCEYVNGRLPTEAEWEKTARGPEGNVYPWGDAAANCDLANMGRCNTETTDVTKHPKGASYYGAGDMAGNVFEWVADWYDPQYYRVSPAENPFGPETGVDRSVRSTAFHSEFYLAEAARRFRDNPLNQRYDLGFRCVVEEPAKFAPWCETVLIVNQDLSGGGPLDVTLPVPTCPDISVTANGFCNKNFNPPQPGALLDFGVDPLPPATTSLAYPPGCILDGTTADPTDFYCAGVGGEGPATIKALCTVPLPPVPPGCAPGYTQNGNICEYAGSPFGNANTQCLPGINYDPATQCCQAIPGGTDSYTLCPVSAPYYAGGVCQAWPIEDIVLKSVSVGFGSCDKPGENGCQLTPNSCKYPNVVDMAKCMCCDPSTGACYKP